MGLRVTNTAWCEQCFASISTKRDRCFYFGTKKWTVCGRCSLKQKVYLLKLAFIGQKELKDIIECINNIFVKIVNFRWGKTTSASSTVE
jgi:hypothetical protein